MAAIASDLSVDENSAVGTELLTLSATDADGDQLTYSTLDTIVTVDSVSGLVTILDSLYFDAEIQDSLIFDVNVSDGVYEDVETVIIIINNINDNAPAFTAFVTDLNVDENSAVGSELLILSASDADGDQLTYSTLDTIVTVDSVSGVVTILDSLYFDAETQDSLILEVKVSDGINEDMVSIAIAINNLNDNAPEMAAIANDLSVDENSAVGTELLTLSATDADGLLNTLVFSSDDEKVHVDSLTGVVTLAADINLDYETATSVSFGVKVSDGKNESVEIVSIAINNLNDNAPVFAQESYMISLLDTDIDDSNLLEFEASDLDQMGDLTYSLTDGYSIFSLTDKGELFIENAENINTNVDTAIYSLVVEVSDGEFVDQASIIVKIDITTGFVSIFSENRVEMYPNPARNETNIEIYGLLDQANIQIWNINGGLVKQQVVSTQVSNIQLDGLKQGVYLVTIQNGNNIIQKRLVVE